MRYTACAVIMVAVFGFGVVRAEACVLDYVLTDTGGNTLRIRPGGVAELDIGETYSLKVDFTSDHGNCLVPAEDTVFLLEEEKWKTGKDYLPLLLKEPVIWKKTGSRTYSADLVFEAALKGDVALEVLRECTKGGYDEYLGFTVR
ncbi:MAG: hypothetical protein JW881_18105 [Spirochaetales bacterium]|nr:hypothetical protein [Spirochaetales bacterium]